MLRKKSDQDQPGVRLATCERSPLGFSHTQNRMSVRPQVAEILLMRSPKPLRGLWEPSTFGLWSGDLSSNVMIRKAQRSIHWDHARRLAGGLQQGVCFITAGPITKLFAWGGEDSGGHVLQGSPRSLLH